MRRMLLAMALATLFSACAPYHDTMRERFEMLPQHYSQFDLKLAWQVKQVSGKTVVDGVARNVRWTYMYDLEIWVTALDKNGKTLARSVSYIIPRRLDMDDSAPFTVKIPEQAPGTTLRITYRYRGSDGGDDERRFGEVGIPWNQSFETEVPRS